MQNLLLTGKGVLKIGAFGTCSLYYPFRVLSKLNWPPPADFGMARPYSPRPLTPGVVTIWYRAPELLLGTKHYSATVDIWSAALVLAELLQCKPCLPGESIIEQLSLIVKLIGSPTPEDLAAFSAMGCPDLIAWQRNELATMMGRADNLERRFGRDTSEGTVKYLRGLLRWDPRGRWTAHEALGKARGDFAANARAWWEESPRATSRDLLPTFPEGRNQDQSRSRRTVGLANRPRREEHGRDDRSTEEGYVFDFGAESSVRRPAKRARQKR